MGPLGKEKNTLSSPRKLSSAKNHFNFKQPFIWTSHREQDCSCVKKSRGRPPYQANKQLVSKADRAAFPEIHPELPQLRDISYNINVKIADEIEVNTLFDWSLPSTRCFLDISPERAPLKPVSQRIWTTGPNPLADMDHPSQIWFPPPNFPFKHRLYHI